MKSEIREAIAECLRRACGAPADQWYAVTRWPDGRIEHRCGSGPVTYGDDEFYGRPGCEKTLYVRYGFERGDEDYSDYTDAERDEGSEDELKAYIDAEIAQAEREAQ